MQKYIMMACFSVFVTCVELSANEERINYIDEVVNTQNNTDSQFTNVELSTPQLPVLSEEQADNVDPVVLDSLAHVDVTTTSTGLPRHAATLYVQCGFLPHTCRAATFLDIVMGFNDSTSQVPYADEGDSSHQTGHGVKKITCIPRNSSDLSSVKILNSSELLHQLGNRNSTSGRCTVVLFYAPWCIFSARIAPHYNALARAFPKLDVVAIDAFHFSNLNSRFGTIAVPNVMIFHNAKAIARFNGSERTLTSLSSFISNVTGIEANLTVEVMEEDSFGPLQSEPSQENDYLVLLSWVFVILCCIAGIGRSSTGIRVWNTFVAIGHHEQHHHQHID